MVRFKVLIFKFYVLLSAGNFTRWGYNQETEECEEFDYGGCKGETTNSQSSHLTEMSR